MSWVTYITYRHYAKLLGDSIAIAMNALPAYRREEIERNERFGVANPARRRTTRVDGYA